MCHLAGVNTFGFLNAYGALQTYYVSALSLSPSTVSWIGLLQAFLLFFTSAISGRLTDAGYFHQTLYIGSLLQLLGFVGASFPTPYWQLLLSHGVCIGLGGGLVFIPSLSLVSTYFSKKRALALAIFAIGNSMGWLIVAAILQGLLPKVGYAWAIRVCGLVVMVSMVLANFILKPRPIERPGERAPVIKWGAFREKTYALFSAGMFFSMLGMLVPVFYVSFVL
jgi:MFS family permease